MAFKLAWQVCKSFGDGKRASPHLRDFLVRALGLVALATIADVVPLSDENRVLVRHGLAGIAGEPTVGLRALMEVSGCLDKKRLTTGTVGFGLAPRINAAGRLERAMMAVEMLTTDDSMPGPARSPLELDRCNARRQEIERQIFDEARAMIEAAGGVGDRRAIVLASQGLAPGRHRHRRRPAGRDLSPADRSSWPSGETIAQGSARSIAGFDLYEAHQGLLRRPARLRRPRRRRRPETAQREHRLDVRPARSRSVAGRSLSARAARARAHDRRRGPARRPDPSRRRGARTASSRTASAIPSPCSWPAGSRSSASPGSSASRRTTFSSGLKQGDVIMKAIGWNLAERGQALDRRLVVLGRLSPVDQRVEQPPRGPARDQGFRAGNARSSHRSPAGGDDRQVCGKQLEHLTVGWRTI